MRVKKYNQEDLERIRNFRLMDDDFMTAVFDGDTRSVEIVLRIIMEKEDLAVKQVKTQWEMHNLTGRSVRIDVYAIDSKGQIYDIEIQRSDKGAGYKRARFNSSLLDMKHLNRGEDHDKLPESFVVFITENDVIDKGLPLYHIERVVMETGELFGDDEHIIYVNGAYSNEKSEIGKLMHDFRQTDPNKMYNQYLANRSRYFKEDEKGVSIMCKAMEEMRNEAKIEGRIEGRIEGKIEGRIEGKIEGALEEQKSRIALKLRKGKSPEEIHEDDEYPMDLILEVQKTL